MAPRYIDDEFSLRQPLRRPSYPSGHRDLITRQSRTSQKLATNRPQTITHANLAQMTASYDPATNDETLDEQLPPILTQRRPSPDPGRMGRKLTLSPLPLRPPYPVNQGGSHPTLASSMEANERRYRSEEELLRKNGNVVYQQHQSDLRTSPIEFTAHPPSYAMTSQDSFNIQRAHQPLAPSVPQFDDISIGIINLGGQDSFRFQSPARNNGHEGARRKSEQPIDDDLAPHFQGLDLSEREDINRKRLVVTEVNKIMQKRLSSADAHSSRRFEFYRFKKHRDDWIIADRVFINVPQDEMERKVRKGKGGTTIPEKMTAVNCLRRDQINRLLDQKTQTERYNHAEWVPVSIETTRQKGRSVLSFDIIIAQSFKPTQKSSFIGEKSDVRDPIKLKRYATTSESYQKSHNHSLSYEDRFFTRDGRPVADIEPVNDARPLEKQNSYDEQRLFTRDGRPVHDTEPVQDARPSKKKEREVDDFENQRLFTEDGRSLTGIEPTNDARPLKSAGSELSLFDDQILFTKSGRPVEVIEPIKDARPIRNKKSELVEFDRQRLLTLNGSPTDDRRPLDTTVSNFDQCGPAELFTDDGTPNMDRRTKDNSRVFDVKGQNSDHLYDEAFERKSRRSTIAESDAVSIDGRSTGIARTLVHTYSRSIGTKGQNTDNSKRKRSFANGLYTEEDPFPEESTQRSVSEPRLWRPRSKFSDAELLADAGDLVGHTDHGMLFGMASIFLYSQPDSTYYSASDNMSNRCESVSPSMSQKRNLSPLQPKIHVDRGQRSRFSDTGPRDYALDMSALRRPTAKISPLSDKAQDYPTTLLSPLGNRRFVRSFILRTHPGTHIYQVPTTCMVCGTKFVDDYARQKHEKLHTDGKLSADNVSVSSSEEVIDAFNIVNDIPIADTKAEAALAMIRPESAAGSVDVHVLKDLRTNDVETISRTHIAPNAPVFSAETDMQLRPHSDRASSLPCLSPNGKPGYDNAMTESMETPVEGLQGLVYYCFTVGCLYSADPGLCDLGPRIARRVHNSETQKLYVLNGLSETGLEAHMWDAHKDEISDLDSACLMDLCTSRHKPSIAEERRFRVASKMFPSASGWLMRICVADGMWGDWMGVDYNIVSASGFIPWGDDLSLGRSQSRTKSPIAATVDEIEGPARNPGDSVDVSASKSRAKLEVPAEGDLHSTSADEGQDPSRLTKAESPHEDSIPTREEPSHHVRMIQEFADSPRPVSALSPSVEADCVLSTPPSPSVESFSDVESRSQRERSLDDDFSNEMSIGVGTQESSTDLSSSTSGKRSCVSGGSKSNSSSDGAKSSCSANQGSEAPSVLSAGKKRVQDRDPTSEDEGDSDQKRHKLVLTSPTTVSVRLLACPFHKHDSKTYSHSNEAQGMAHKFRTCGGPGWPTVARLKEHLYRVHPIPIQCSRCWLTMKTERELQDHSRSEIPCPVLPQLVQWVPRDKIEVLKDRRKALSGKNEEERWHSVYEILFPDDPSVPSPYYDDLEPKSQGDTQAFSSQHESAALEQYTMENLPRRVMDAVEALLIEESLKKLIPEVVRTCQAQIFRDWAQLKSGSSGVGITTDALVSQNHNTEQGAGQGAQGQQLAAPVSTGARDESLLAFYIDSAPAANEGNFESPLPLAADDNGEVSSQSRPDSGYGALPQYSDSFDCEVLPTSTPTGAVVDAGVHSYREDRLSAMSDLGMSADNSCWDPFLSNPYQCSLHHDLGEICRVCDAT